jgi:MFS family permease
LYITSNAYRLKSLVFNRDLNVKFYFGWIVVLGSALTLMLGAGILMIFGVFLTSLIQEFHWSRAAVSAGMSINTILLGVFGALVGRLTDRFGSKIVITLGIVVSSIALYLLGYTSSLLDLYLLYGVLSGFGIICMQDVPTSAAVSRWFARRRSLALSLSSIGFCVGMIVFPSLASYVILINGWRLAFQVLGGMALVVGLPVVVLMIRSHPRSEDELASDEMKIDRIEVKTAPISMEIAIRTDTFLVLSFGYFACGFTDFLIIVHVVTYAISLGIPPLASAFTISLMGGANIPGLIVMGALSHRKGVRPTLALTYFIRFLSFIILTFFVSDILTLYLFAIVTGITSFTTGPLTASLVARTFGPSSMGTVYGSAILIHMIGGTVGSYIGGTFYDLTQSYFIPFLIGTLLLASTSAVVFITKMAQVYTSPMSS